MSWMIRFSMRPDLPVPFAPMIYKPCRREDCEMSTGCPVGVSVPSVEKVIQYYPTLMLEVTVVVETIVPPQSQKDNIGWLPRIRLYYSPKEIFLRSSSVCLYTMP